MGYPTSLSSSATSANADINTKLTLPSPTASFPWGGTVAGTPNGFGVATDTADLSGSPANVPDGAVAGTLTSTVQLAVNALGANACFAPVIVPFAMVDATVDTTATIGGSPADTIWPGNADGDADGLPDAVTLWPTFLDAQLANLNPGGAPPVPIARYHGQILVAPPSPTNLELVVFSPGALPDYPASMGHVTVSYLEDSLAPTTPSSISMTCTAAAPAIFTNTTIFGSSAGAPVLFPNVGLPPAGGSLVQTDPATGFPFPGSDICDGLDNNGVNGIDEGCGFLLRENPSTAGSYTFDINAITGRDTDNDGITNQLDKCLLEVDAHPTHADIHAPFDPIGLTYTPPGGLGYNPYWPAAVIFPQPADPDDDNLANSCDPSPFVPSVGGPFGFDEDVFSEGFTPPFTQFFSNGQDNCPLIGNPSQANSDASVIAINIGPNSDFMGDACDPNPLISDGHAHSDFAIGPVCVGGTDADGDGWCASDDSDDSDASKQVEDIAFPRTCDDGVDNDGDGTTDLTDTGCQLPNHDLAIFPPQVNGSAAPSSGQTNSYKVLVKNNTGSPEVARIAFLIDETSQGLADSCGVTINSINSAGLVAGSDEVGFINQDTGGYPAASSAPLGSLATDMELEAFATAEVTINANSARQVKIFTTWSCAADTGGPDFTVNVDVCHPGDQTLGVFPPLSPLGDSCGVVGSDGGQDRVNTGNDAELTKTIDVQ